MDLWFGDSWVIGSELGLSVFNNDFDENQSLKQRAVMVAIKRNGTAKYDKDGGKLIVSSYNNYDSLNFDRNIFPNVVDGLDNPLKAFPAHVSKYRNQSYINFAMGGSSIEFSYHQLVKFCSKNAADLTSNNEKHTAFLCLTSPIRDFGIDHRNNEFYHWNNTNLKSPDYTAIYDSIMAINGFYTTCKLFNIECFIIPIFRDLEIPDNEVFKELILFETSILSYISLLELTFKEKLVPGVSVNLDFSKKEWIEPNYSHPNEKGHEQLASKLIELLENH
jgi:hypothetical protein